MDLRTRRRREIIKKPEDRKDRFYYLVFLPANEPCPTISNRIGSIGGTSFRRHFTFCDSVLVIVPLFTVFFLPPVGRRRGKSIKQRTKKRGRLSGHEEPKEERIIVLSLNKSDSDETLSATFPLSRN